MLYHRLLYMTGEVQIMRCSQCSWTGRSASESPSGRRSADRGKGFTSTFGFSSASSSPSASPPSSPSADSDDSSSPASSEAASLAALVAFTSPSEPCVPASSSCANERLQASAAIPKNNHRVVQRVIPSLLGQAWLTENHNIESVGHTGTRFLSSETFGGSLLKCSATVAN